MVGKNVIYLDNAATTYPKPPSVAEEMKKCLELYGGNPGRGAHYLSMVAAEKVYECRETLADFFGAEGAERVFFTLNTTYALNTAIKGSIRDGDHVIISELEHNAVWRPLRKLAEEGRISYSVFPVLKNGKKMTEREIVAGIMKLVKVNTRMLVCTHSSNICSVSLPIASIGRLCHSLGIIFVVDAAQSAGHEAINIKDMKIDMLCLPGHKGLYGPQGCGMCILGGREMPETIIEGGNGIYSLEWMMSPEPPERYEAGTLPTPAIAGLTEGIKAVKEMGREEIEKRERVLFERGVEILSAVKGVKICLPEEKGAILSFNMEGIDPDSLASELDRRGICVRGGYHCASLAHRALGTDDRGSVRLSFGIYNTNAQLERVGTVLRAISEGV